VSSIDLRRVHTYPRRMSVGDVQFSVVTTVAYRLRSSPSAANINGNLHRTRGESDCETVWGRAPVLECDPMETSCVVNWFRSFTLHVYKLVPITSPYYLFTFNFSSSCPLGDECMSSLFTVVGNLLSMLHPSLMSSKNSIYPVFCGLLRGVFEQVPLRLVPLVCGK